MNCRLNFRGLKSAITAWSVLVGLASLVSAGWAASGSASVRSVTAGSGASTAVHYASVESALLSPGSLQAIAEAPMIGFVVDNTGSTDALVTGVRQGIAAFVAALPSVVGQPPQFLLETFNDPTVGEPLVTSSGADLLSAALGIVPNGGGDCPELAMTGLLRALGAASPRSVLFLFTDADAKDCAKSQLVVALARLKNVTIINVTTGDCSGESSFSAANARTIGGDRARRRTAPKGVAATTVNAANCGTAGFGEVSTQTGGVWIDDDFSDAQAVGGIQLPYLDTGIAEIASLSGSLLSGTNVRQIPVDNTVDALDILVTMDILTSVIIRQPNGSVLNLNGPGITHFSFSRGQATNITDPAPGIWQVEMVGAGKYALNALASSSVRLSSFEFVTVEPGPTYVPTNVLPRVGTLQAGILTWDGLAAPTTTRLVDSDGNVLTTLSPVSAAGLQSNQYRANVVPTATPFRAQISGVDNQGNVYQRVARQLTRATDVLLTASQVPAQMNANNFYSFLVTVQNTGTPRTFDIAADADHRMDSVTPSPAQLTLGTNQSANVLVTVSVPLDFLTTATVNFAVSALDQSGLGNAIVVPVLVLENQPPDCSGAHVIGFDSTRLSYALEPIAFGGIYDPENQPVSVEAFDITQDEPVENNTGAQANGTCPDARSDGGVTYLRNENATNGDGRIYRGRFVATDPQGKQCEGTFSYCVPKHHGRGDQCLDDGYRYSSTGACTRFNFNPEPGAPLAAEPAIAVQASGANLTLSVSGVADLGLDMQVFDISGRLVQKLWDGPVDGGALEMNWDTSRLGAGIYFVRARVGGTQLVRKVIVSR